MLQIVIYALLKWKNCIHVINYIPFSTRMNLHEFDDLISGTLLLNFI